jgi:Tfp pilus assembly protein PilN
MRPVNLIPVEERRDGPKPMRGGPLAYIVLGALLAALGAVTLLVVTDNQISSRTTELTELKAQTASAEAEAVRLTPYVQLHSISAQRTETISNLANSRFDWEQVMRQLSLVLPSNVWLTNLTGTVRPDVAVGGGESIGLRESVAGPALAIVGCAPGQEAVARFVTVLKDIDGVTRVGVQSSELPDSSSGGEGTGSESASGGCQTRNFIAQFQIVVAFDAAPIPTSATGETEAVVAPEEAAEPSSESSTTAAEGE